MAGTPRPFYGEFAWAFDLLIDRPSPRNARQSPAGWLNVASSRAQDFSMRAAERDGTRSSSVAEATL